MSATAVVGRIASGLAQDVKTWGLPRFWHWFERERTRAKARPFDSIHELQQRFADLTLGSGDWVRLRCKPLAFGPMLASHFMPPVIGLRSDLRLGPQLLSNTPYLGAFAQITSHWMPVGLYPPMGDHVSQVTLYPHDAVACGVLGMTPITGNLVPSIPAVMPNRLADFFGYSGWLTAQTQRVDVDAFVAAGYSPEDYEGFRQAGGGWFLDGTHEYSQFELLPDAAPTEMWGGLYAAGHIEIGGDPGRLKIGDVVEAVRTAIRGMAEEPQVIQNQVREKAIYIFARGVRASILPGLPIYSIHMDADIGRGFAEARRRFDLLTASVLRGIADACTAKSADLLNPGDLDFTYVDSTKAYSVLRSRASEHITHPLLVAVREWHRQRGGPPAR